MAFAGIDNLPARQFHKGSGHTAHLVESESLAPGGIRIVTTLCGLKGMYSAPEFRETKSRRYVDAYCSGCSDSYASEHGNRLPMSDNDC